MGKKTRTKVIIAAKLSLTAIRQDVLSTFATQCDRLAAATATVLSKRA